MSHVSKTLDAHIFQTAHLQFITHRLSVKKSKSHTGRKKLENLRKILHRSHERHYTTERRSSWWEIWVRGSLIKTKVPNICLPASEMWEFCVCLSFYDDDNCKLNIFLGFLECWLDKTKQKQDPLTSGKLWNRTVNPDNENVSLLQLYLYVSSSDPLALSNMAALGNGFWHSRLVGSADHMHHSWKHSVAVCTLSISDVFVDWGVRVCR